MFCGQCGKEVKHAVAFCPFCENKLPKEQPKYQEVVVENENWEEAQEKKEKRSFKPRLVWKRMALGIGVLCLVAILGVVVHSVTKTDKGKDTENGIQVASTENTKKQAPVKQENWDLFQTNAEKEALSAEEKNWLQNIFESYGKNAKKAMYEENMLSFQVLPLTERDGNLVTAYSVMEKHSLKKLEYVDEISYIKIQFDCEKEPELEDIKVWTANLDDNKYTKAKASSVLGAQHNNASADREICTYEAQNITDGDITTAWIEGKKGFGEGSSITLADANSEKHMVYGFCIKNGFTKTQRTLERNAQVKEVEVSSSKGNTAKYTLKKNVHTSYMDDWFSDCIVLDDPQHFDYKEKTIFGNQEDENPVYDSWQQAYEEQIRNLDALMEKYKESIQLYLDAQKFIYTSLDYFYESDGTLSEPTDGFLQDLDDDQIPELCLYKAIGDDEFLMHMVHVFSVDEENHLLYCGSFFYRPDEENQWMKPLVRDTQSGGLDVLLCDAEIYGSYEYNTYLVENKKLKQTQSIVSEQTSESIGDIRNYRKNGTSMDKKRYDTYVSERQNREEIVSYDMNELLNTLEGE